MASAPTLSDGSTRFPRLRREARTEEVRIVDYAGFPRVADDPGLRVGFTRDHSPSGMCLGVDEAENVGSLLRVVIRDLQGRPARCAVERVVWCRPARDGRFWIGLELVAEQRAVAQAT